MSDKLCPFCGGSECYSVDDYGDVSVACLYKTHGDTWNARPLEDAANARAEAAEAKVAALQAALEEEGHRNAVFTACLHKAQNLYLEAHPDYPGWPDGAVNITWVLEAFDKERAEVKRLRTALQAANEDAERLASVLEDDGYPVKKLPMNAKRLSLAAHRARVGGAS